MENLSGRILHKATLDFVVTIVKIYTRNESSKYKIYLNNFLPKINTDFVN